ncbi:MAG: PatB family C-S lyase [Muribaculaceae bacterium]|nr:PatB family C-S lyase [Muribaculaceae bacterium]
MNYNFDLEINRRGTGAMKTDALTTFFGREDVEALWIADMDFAVAPEITRALAGRFAHAIYGYSAVPESYWDSIIDWLATRHNWKVDRADLIYVNGVVKGIGFLINYFTSKGEKILIQPPVYHPFRRLIEENGRECVCSPLKRTADGYTMDLDDLERCFREERPAMMILCNPHNPIGLQWSRETLATVARLAKKYGVKVISDEIHGDLVLWDKPHIPFLEACPEAAEVGIALGAPSKTFNIPGLSSSWIVIKSEELKKGFFHWMEANEFSEPTFVATIATETAYRYGEPWLNEAMTYIEENIKAVEEFCASQMPVIKPVRPEASFLVWLDCRELGLPHDQLVDLFVNNAHLALNDGAMFGEEGSGFMRFNVASPRHVVMRCLGRLAECINHDRCQKIDSRENP